MEIVQHAVHCTFKCSFSHGPVLNQTKYFPFFSRKGAVAMPKVSPSQAAKLPGAGVSSALRAGAGAVFREEFLPEESDSEVDVS